ncbi:MAG: alkaline phosphatase family protein, partial [Candidatus Korobacteraceae bacterium]
MRKYVPLVLTLVFSVSLFAGASSSSSSGIVSSLGAAASNPALQPIQHIIFMLQENRSFDHYFGHLNAYRATLGLPAAADDLVSPHDPNSGKAETLNPNPTHDGSTCPWSTTTGTCTPFKMVSDCIWDLTPAWNEAHVDLTANISSKVLMNGFAREAGTYSLSYPDKKNGNAIYDVGGWRAMGYYDYTQLNYYYYLATQFATSDRWYSPVLSKSEPNHLFGLAGTSQGWIVVPTKQLPAPTIFNLLQKAGVTWKVYYTDTIPG